ncbi:MAG TPA: bifunctional serine/threonine-protein kinase/formylglycine-generating enzyme family protein [Pyrinomonadaceae bacterium]
MLTEAQKYEVVDQALQIADEDSRRKYIEEACGGHKDTINDVWLLYGLARPFWDEEEPVRVDDTIGNYKLVRELGRGLIARVYLASHNIINNYAAIKVFKKSAVSIDGEEMWRRDPSLLSRLNHDNIVRFYDAGVTEDNVPYVVMEYVHGTKIDSYCNKERLSVLDRLILFRQLCEVLRYIHDNKIAHLDLKPSNILVTSSPKGRLKLIDFGAGKLLQFAAHQGSLPLSRLTIAFSRDYASPEQIKGEYERINETSDIYSLGAVLYKLLTNQPPLKFTDDSIDEIRKIISSERPLSPSHCLSTFSTAEGNHESVSIGRQELNQVSKERNCRPEHLLQLVRGDLDSIVMKCLEKEQDKRYQKVEELATDVDNFLTGQPVNARRGGWSYKFDKSATKLIGLKMGLFGLRKWVVPSFRIAGFVVLLGVLLAVGWTTMFKSLEMKTEDNRLYKVRLYDETGKFTQRDKAFNILVQTVAPGINLELMPVQAPGPDAPFIMGSGDWELVDIKDQSEKDQLAEQTPRHPAKIQSFYLGRTEVTQAQWRAVAMLPEVTMELDPEPSDIKERSAPVTNVSYMDALEFCARLSKATGRNYRLPTEAEWEYSCRAGTGTTFGFGNTLTTDVANFRVNDEDEGKKPKPASQLKAGNSFGLFNMNGNVWEWTQDRWHPNYNGNPHTDEKAWETIINFPVEDGTEVSNEFFRVIRGGSFEFRANWCRCASRTLGNASRPDLGRNGQTGFRVALTMN